ncbi:uncharacterized protein CXQ87_001297 [Candidozyma duobushaemuli]|uniref:Kinetochore protein SPC25 n=1 Tax=Candidozyma duobushaemuli TaxID=1231522 RepID=A0A2V1AKW9_9ASCO|nr:uncharacterized protein CXQ87_001297 [[Candida] duobushaemulonis]PVH18372.1 hypothetical protein CXQ87_001297 [[Candida] duobushaemulonis]
MSLTTPAVQEFNSLLKEMEDFTSRFQTFTLQKKSAISSSKSQHINRVKEFEKRARSLQAEIKATTEKSEKTEALAAQSLLDLQAKQEKVDALTAQSDSRLAAKDQLNRDIDNLRKEVAELENILKNTRSTLGDQAIKDAEELTKFEQYLGLRIEAVDIDLLKFKFVNIDPNNVDREVWCELNVAEQEYKVGLTNPNLPRDVILRIQKDLNMHGELVIFLQSMRNALRAEVS